MATKILKGVSSEYDEYMVVVHGVKWWFDTVESAERFLEANGLRPLGADCDAFQLVEGAGKTFLRIVAEVDEWEIWN